MKPLKYRRQPRPVLRLQAWAQRLARQAAAGNEAGRPDRNKRIPPSLDLQLLVFAVLTFTFMPKTILVVSESRDYRLVTSPCC